MSAIKTYRKGGREVTAMRIDTADDVRELRAAEDWHEGAVAVLTYPTLDPVAYVALDNPKSFCGQRVQPGNVVVKGEAGDFRVVDGTMFDTDYEEVEAA